GSGLCGDDADDLDGKVEVVRIVATEAGTTLSYDPPQSGAGTTLAQPGDFVEIDGNDQTFRIQATHKVLVAQYMEGQTVGETQLETGTGDPAMALAVPVAQYRASYLFHAPINYER